MAALGYEGEVTSPTFTLSRIYPLASGLELHHYDLYRLSGAGVVGDELAEDMADPHIITVIEWADIITADLPADRLKITFEVTGDTDRRLTFTSGGPKSAAIITALQEAA